MSGIDPRPGWNLVYSLYCDGQDTGIDFKTKAAAEAARRSYQEIWTRHVYKIHRAAGRRK